MRNPLPLEDEGDYGDYGDEEYQNEADLENVQSISKSQKYLGYIGKPIRGPEKQPLYSFQPAHQPIKNRVNAQEKKGVSFKQLFEYYKPLIDAKNKKENQDILNRNIFQDEQFYEEKKTDVMGFTIV